ncbi:PrgI family protein [Candidatus Dojkabacteria bacterium]|nr:PrgI family protein [Candidatus Dojkabacteria bacterium]
MDKHAIPQNIMDVEFKLFGSLTIRQFFSLAGGILIAVVIYFIGLPWIVGWPLMAVALIIGFSLTFITINGQPFSRWFSNYISAMFSSQRYVWKKSPKTPKVLRSTQVKKTKQNEGRSKKTQKEFGALPIIEAVNQQSTQIDADETKELQRLDQYFNAEFGKTFAQNYTIPEVKEGPRRVEEEQQSIAGEVNPIGRGQRNVKTGQDRSFVYTNTQNQRPRPLGFSSEEQRIEQKIKDILEMQQELNPYMKTSDVEARETQLKEEMKKLYQEIQNMKKNK